MSLPVLDPVAVRVLGSLVEKDLTTPAYYPLSLNALTQACNQLNNREPVVAFSEAEAGRALDELRQHRLAYVVTGGDSRVLKFGHRLGETLELDRPAVALLTVLLLRGPQTPGELRGRTGRMHGFADLPDVLATLGALAARPAPLVAVLPRQPGTKEARYAHLLGGTPTPVAEPAPAGPPPAPGDTPGDDARVAALAEEVAQLRRQVAELEQQFAAFRRQFE